MLAEHPQRAGPLVGAQMRFLIGKTKGRGRQDRAHDHAKTVKSNYVYALKAGWRTRMGVAEPVPMSAPT